MSAKSAVRGLALLMCGAALPFAVSQPQLPKNEFISLDAAKPLLATYSASLPEDLRPANSIHSAKWDAWVKKSDQAVRDRLDRGEEDTLTNLLRFGVTYTKEFRIDDDYLARYGQSSLVNSFAENRANDLIRALSAPSTWPSNSRESMARMSRLLQKKGFSFTTPQNRRLLKKYLLDNLARMRDDMQRYRAPATSGTEAQRFKDRGISLDTNLWPDFLLDQHFRRMAEKGLLKPGSIKKIAIVGPGLDFANKEAGNDFYPPQTIQPFAALDSLLRLGLADPKSVEIYTLDISSEVNFHVARARKNALAGHSYIVQLPWNTSARQSQEYRTSFVEYWKRLGDQIGVPVPPIAVPSVVAGTQSRAVKIRADVVKRLTPLDMNIVFQRTPLTSGQAFDLIIGTNIFIYYSAFEQSLARANISSMLKPGGFLLSNDKFPDSVPSGLVSCMETSLVVARDPDRVDTMFCYGK
jgi:hypothetical protein